MAAEVIIEKPVKIESELGHHEYEVIGKSVQRVDAVAKVKGETKFSPDISLPHMLHAKILFSDRPHAKIRSIDTQNAMALPGVAAIVTARDMPEKRYGIYIWDKQLFAKERVVFVGQPVAAVAAINEEIAAQAVALIRVEYKDLPAVFDPEDALADGAPLVHPEYEDYVTIYPYIRHGNLCMEARLSQGDVKRAFAEADHIVESTYSTAGLHQGYLEPHTCVASFDVTGRLTIWSSTQMLSVNHWETAQALDMPMSRLRLIATGMGGGFGGKLNSRFEPICGLLAMATHRPVRLALTREEDFLASHPRAPFRIHIKLGVRRDGTLVAGDFDVLADAGAFSDEVVGTALSAITHTQGTYHIPHCRARARAVYTNNPNWGCVRGYGVAQQLFALESHMDDIAHALNMDPADLRVKNLYQEGDVLLTTQRARCVTIRETMEQALEISGYREKKGKLEPHHGIGFANIVKTSGYLGSSASVRMNEDGTITVMTAISDIGAGAHTVLCQIAAEVLGVPLENVHVASPDSDSSPYDIGTFASRTTYDSGNAVRLAAQDVRAQMAALAAERLGCSPEIMVAGGGRIYRQDQPNQGLSIEDVVGLALYAHHGPLIGHGSWLGTPEFPEPVGEGYGAHPYPTFGYATHVAEVEVDPDTGHVDILHYTAIHDAGKIINPAGAAGQIQGGVVQGIGSSLYEELLLENGRMINPSLTDYLIPTVMEAPQINLGFVEEPDETGPFGAKGIGEHPMLGPAPAIANAIFDAVGVRVRQIPITPERLYFSIRERGQESDQRPT